ncbi:YbaB/EbfC family nucleoid-associated protein [Saccharopolyspora cebuensis]|uniref:YbaB/EbfC family nucleoid-associated protein n=1 Tax=Saccharopolyspora cebuensis TaxID=418759 RepID=A0ABV4CL97_9PSEU
MDIEDRIAQAMRQLQSNVDKASKNPEAVLQGNFSGTSGNVTVWVDALGRTERCRILPNSVFEGDEFRLVEAFNEATKEARRKAENLEFEDEAEGRHERPAPESPNRQRSWADDHVEEESATWLR